MMRRSAARKNKVDPRSEDNFRIDGLTACGDTLPDPMPGNP